MSRGSGVHVNLIVQEVSQAAREKTEQTIKLVRVSGRETIVALVRLSQLVSAVGLNQLISSQLVLRSTEITSSLAVCRVNSDDKYCCKIKKN